jgi:hypothetical protein
MSKADDKNLSIFRLIYYNKKNNLKKILKNRKFNNEFIIEVKLKKIKKSM